jgi:hypothetical protein
VIERDRELLARVARLNGRLGKVVLELIQYQDGGELPATGVRELGQALTELGADLLTRAAELERVASTRHPRHPVSATARQRRADWALTSPLFPDPVGGDDDADRSPRRSAGTKKPPCTRPKTRFTGACFDS